MGGLLFGYDWVVIGGAKIFYEPFFGLEGSAALRGWAMSSALIGCLAGALLSGEWSDKYGRKKMLIIASFLFVLSAYGTGAVDSFNWFIIYRIVGGFGIGIASNISPVYIAEVAPASVRGKFVSLNQLTIVLGILMAQLANWQIGEYFTHRPEHRSAGVRKLSPKHPSQPCEGCFFVNLLKILPQLWHSLQKLRNSIKNIDRGRPVPARHNRCR